MKLKYLCSAVVSIAATLAANPVRAHADKKLPIPAGTQIQKGEKYVLPSGNHYLALQDDGNLVVKETDGRYL